MLRTLARAGLLIAFSGSLGAQSQPQKSPASAPVAAPLFMRDPTHAPGRDLTVSLLTMGDGDQVWENFGHSAIWLHDNTTNRDTVFNWGVFNMREPHFILHFLQGLNNYAIGGDQLGFMLYNYRYWNRSVTAQELNLTDAEKDSLVHMINVNTEPQNVYYRYDYFVENCSTRPRDMLDRVLGGQLRVGADSLSGTSYRYHALRLMQGNKPLVLGVNIGLGEPSDKPITKWQEMFLPEKLHDWVATRQVRDSTGALRPLVKSERMLFTATRGPEPKSPPSFAWLWVVGATLGAAFAALGVAAKRSRAARITAGVVFSIWAVAGGILGLLLTALWTVTDHHFAHANENLLLFNPLWLVLAVTLPMTLIKRRASRVTDSLMLVLVVTSALALVAHIGISRQTNIAIVGLGLLPTLGIFFAERQARNVQRGLA